MLFRAHRLSLAARLRGAGGLVLLAFAAMAAAAVWGLAAAQRSLTFVQANALQPLLQLSGVQMQTHLAIAEMLRAIQHAPASFTAPLHDHPVSAHLKALAAQREHAQALWQEYLATTLDADERALAQRTGEALQQWHARLDEAVAAIDAGDYAPARVATFLVASRTQAKAALEALEELKAYQARIGEREAAAAGRRLQLALGLLGACVVLLAAPALWLGHRALRRQQCGFDATLSAARAIADGDLTHSVPADDGADEVGQLLRSLRTMQTRLHDIVGEVRTQAHGVAATSTQIAQSNLDLSARTGQQASALQQTTATVTQLGATVRDNAEHTARANALAQGVADAAARGGVVMDEATATMRGIDDASRRIADISGTIDALAFQTNLLALNAAVEAARAGAQGRGFAVVAAEVRSLAQRSATAAREIKALIDASVERVAEGVAQVGRAGAAMQDIVSSVRSVTQLIGEIAAASRTQRDGVEHVGRAVGEMDHSTQHNAALVEQTSAAAQMLAAQAQRLLALVSAFRTQAAADGAPQPPAPQPAGA